MGAYFGSTEIRRHIISSHDIIATAPRRRKSWPVVRRPTSSDGHTRNFGETKLTRGAPAFWQNKATASAGAIFDKTKLIRSPAHFGGLNLDGKKQRFQSGHAQRAWLPPPRPPPQAAEGDQPPCRGLPSPAPFGAADQVIEIDLELLGLADVALQLLEVGDGEFRRRRAGRLGDELDHGGVL